MRSLEQGGVFALLGPTGVGKTTTVAKLAARFAISHGSEHVALVTTDSYRIGAHEQLRSFARIIDIPMRVANDEGELSLSLEHFYDRRLVLIDTAGMSQRDVRFAEQAAHMRRGSPRVRNYLVLSATTQFTGLREAVQAFGQAPIDGCVITKLDECTSLGAVLTVLLEHDMPAAYVADGQRVPEDVAPAEADTLVARAVALA